MAAIENLLAEDRPTGTQPPIVDASAPCNDAVTAHFVAGEADSLSEVAAELTPIDIDAALAATDHWESLTQVLSDEIDSAYRQPLAIRAGKGKSFTDCPISVDAYKDATFTYDVSPALPTEGCTVLDKIAFGYIIKGEFRVIGSIDFLVLRADGSVQEVGCRTVASSHATQHAEYEHPLSIFKENLFGRTLTESEILRQYEVNEAVIRALQQNAECKVALDAFVAKREHEPEWGEAAKLAYYSPSSFDVLKWGTENGFSARELYQAGFVDRRVSKNGVSYANRHEDVVFIPFHNDEDRIVLWRMRLVNPKEGEPKYRGAPLDRAYRQPETVHRQLFHAELLKDVRDKPLLITEGEFKCMVATKMSGYATVGITGITQITDEIIKELVKAGPSQIIIVLDRDPKGKGLSRTDELTDSERAAYLLALRLKRAGYDNATIGTIPNVFDGSKCGIDDLLLHLGDKAWEEELESLGKHSLAPDELATRRLEVRNLAATRAIKKIIAESCTTDEIEGPSGPTLTTTQPDQAKQVDAQLHRLYERRQRVNQILRDFRRYVERSPLFASGSAEDIRAERTLTELSEMATTLDDAFRSYLKVNYNGTKRISQPPMNHLTLFATSTIHEPELKTLVASDGVAIKAIGLERDVLILQAHPRDLPEKGPLRGAPGISFPHSMRELTNAFENGVAPSSHIRERFNRGRHALGDSGPARGWSGMSYDEFIDRVFAGFIAEIYPTDEYSFKSNVTLRKTHSSYVEEVATVKLMILKDGNVPVALCSLPRWKHRENGPEGSLALLSQGHTREGIRAFLRNPALISQHKQLDRIATAMAKIAAPRSKLDAAVYLKVFGISSEAAERTGALLLRRQDMDSLVKQMPSEKLLNQCFHAGLFTATPEGNARPRFQGDAIFIPERDINGFMVGFTVIPCHGGDRISGSLPPLPKSAFPLDSARSVGMSFDMTGLLYQERELRNARGKTVLVASSEVEAMQLQSLVIASRRHDIIVVGLREHGTLSNSSAKVLANSGAASIVFLGQEASYHQARQRFAPLALEDAITQAQAFSKVHSTEKTRVSAVITTESLQDILTATSEPQTALSHLLNAAREVRKDRAELQGYTAAKREFSELLRNAEIAYADRNEPMARDHQERIATTALLRSFYNRILAGSENRVFPGSLEEFLAGRYSVSTESSIDALFRRRATLIYSHGRTLALNPDAERSATLRGLHTKNSEPRTGVPTNLALPSWRAGSNEYPTAGATIGDPGRITFERELRVFCSNDHRFERQDAVLPPIQVRGKQFVGHRVSLTLDGVEFEGSGYAHSPSAAHHLATADVRRQVIASQSEVGEAFRSSCAWLADLIQREIDSQDRKAISALNTLVTSLRQRHESVVLVEHLPLPAAQDGLLLSRYTVTIDGTKHTGTSLGMTPRGSQRLAAEDLLDTLSSLGYALPAPKPPRESDPVSFINEELMRLGHRCTVENGKAVMEQCAGESGNFWRATRVIKVDGRTSLPGIGEDKDAKVARQKAARELLPELTRLTALIGTEPTIKVPKSPRDQKRSELDKTLSRLFQELRAKYGDMIGKLTKKVQSLQPKVGSAKYEITILGKNYTHVGMGTSGSLARSDAVAQMVEFLTNHDWSECDAELARRNQSGGDAEASQEHGAESRE